MGAVLAMMSLKQIRITVGIVIVALLAGCSNEGPSALTQSVRSIGTQLINRDTTERDARAVLTPEVVAATQRPYLLVAIPSRQASATRFLFDQRGPVQDWRGEDGIGLVLHNDVLVATRGLGADLFAADPVAGNIGQLRPGVRYARSFRHLDGENRELVSTYSCSLAEGRGGAVDLIARRVATRSIVESCDPSDTTQPAIQNEYWVGIADNITWKSKQWVSTSVGYATLYHLVR